MWALPLMLGLCADYGRYRLGPRLGPDSAVDYPGCVNVVVQWTRTGTCRVEMGRVEDVVGVTELCNM
ncbi:hypothetical protein ACOMHN_017363 [Nucella lapillus]